MANLVIGIEGLVGAGKTSICRELIKMIPNAVLVHGGNIYRAIVAAMLENKDLAELKTNSANLDMKQLMDYLGIELKLENNETVLYCKGKLIDEEHLQSKEISLAVSSLGGRTNEKALFDYARNIIDDLKQEYNVILSGRGLLTIYPECDYHIFITASLEARVQRKANQYHVENKTKTSNTGNVNEDKTDSIDDIRGNIIKRDELQKQVGYYDISEKTIEVDVTDCVSAKESAIKVLENLKMPLEV